ncbi:MAG: flagellar motor switch phosphatase FliY [Thermoanaerobacterales bacterium]|nr:flagellar motor switch phosphatase FliY [Thermoanaerobacterales bacterium]
MDEQLLSDDEIMELMKDVNNVPLSKEEMDALGEIGNISIGTSATTLYSLLRNRVVITTPNVNITNVSTLKSSYPIPFITVEVSFTKGLFGSNLMIIKEEDAKIIADLMMGGDGKNTDVELDELRISAVGEAMNQMMGSAATSLSTMLKKDISISPPRLKRVNFATENLKDNFQENEEIVNISFKLEVGDILDSEIMQLMPISFAKMLVQDLFNLSLPDENQRPEQEMQQGQNNSPLGDQHIEEDAVNKEEQLRNSPKTNPDHDNNKLPPPVLSENSNKIAVNPVQFEAFDDSKPLSEGSNLDLIMDVPLEVSVELGRTTKTVKEIVELGTGSIVELNKMAGEHVDILVNGKLIAKGEVVVVDENFGVRIIDILNNFEKISSLQ